MRTATSARRLLSGLTTALAVGCLVAAQALAASNPHRSATAAPERPFLAAGPVNNCPPPPSGVGFYAPQVAGRQRTVALTFDDGPGPSTPAILSILEAYGVRATFFNIGEQEAARPADVVAEEAAGFLVGDHTWSHPDLVPLPVAAQAAQIDDEATEQRALTGTSPCVFRPPYGDYDAETLGLASTRRMGVWLWSVDTEDWQAEGSGSSYWVQRIISLAESEGGALDHPVVLMHNQAIPMPATVAALPTVISFFRQRGYAFVDLLGRTGPPSGCGTAPPAEPATRLAGGTRLAAPGIIRSPGGQYELAMQRDGNLVEYTSAGRALWASGTQGSPGAAAVMERDGDLVVIARSGGVLWQTRTAGHPGAVLGVRGDGNLVVTSASGVLLWQSGSDNDRLAPGERLETGWSLVSRGSGCRLVLQRDGNLVLYSATGRPVWASGTSGHPGDEVTMQQDGDLLIRTVSGSVLWTSRTGGVPGASLFVSRDASLFVERTDGDIGWYA